LPDVGEERYIGDFLLSRGERQDFSARREGMSCYEGGVDAGSSVTGRERAATRKNGRGANRKKSREEGWVCTNCPDQFGSSLGEKRSARGGKRGEIISPQAQHFGGKAEPER